MTEENGRDRLGGFHQRRPRPDRARSGGLGRQRRRVGAGEIVLTSMDADGTKAGYDLEMTRAVSQAVSIPVVASGGAGSPEHLYQVLTEGHADAALAASIFHYNEYGIPATKKYLAERGVPMCMARYALRLASGDAEPPSPVSPECSGETMLFIWEVHPCP